MISYTFLGYRHKANTSVSARETTVCIDKKIRSIRYTIL